MVSPHIKSIERWDWLLPRITLCLPLFGVIVALLMWSQGYGPTKVDLFLLVLMYSLTVIGVEVGYHRFFSHRAFKAGKFLTATFAILGSMALQGPVIWWVALHRRHHGSTDRQGDPHSPHLAGKGWKNTIAGFYHAHFLWNFDLQSTKPSGWAKPVGDLYDNEIVFFVHVTYLRWVIVGLVIPAVLGGVISGSFLGAFTGFIWGGLVRIFLCLHAFGALNSVCHLFGSRPFKLKADQSTNNIFVVLPTFGEGWHNNHHAFPWSATTSFKWYQLDIGGLLIKMLKHTGLVWDIKIPTKENLQHKLNRSAIHNTELEEKQNS